MIIKNDKDLHGIRESGKRLAEVLEFLKEKVSAGISTKEIDDLSREKIRALNCMPAFLNYKPAQHMRPFPASICVSVNSELVHGIPNEKSKIIKRGDILKLDCGVNFDGYFTDSAITVGIGEISKKNAKLISDTRDALYAQISVARAGGTIGDIGFESQEIAEKFGYGYPKHLGGHGVGKMVHEQPFVYNYGHRDTGEKLIDGMVLALEPMFATGSGNTTIASDGYTYILTDGGIGAHFEHTVIIRKGDAEIVTKI